MERDGYKIFSQGRIGKLSLPNCLVRSATWAGINNTRMVSDELLHMYIKLAEGGVGMIITGGIKAFTTEKSPDGTYSYPAMQIDGISRMADAVHQAAPACKIVAQICGGRAVGVGPSDVPAPLFVKRIRALSVNEIKEVVKRFAEAIVSMKEAGFDGVQIHAAHGKFCLWPFLSPYTNHRTDRYGGSARNRARIIGEIVSEARAQVGDLPILIKINCTDNVEGGVDIETFPEMAREIERTGVDAIEVSGGSLYCLALTQDELGFRPVWSPESHTRINSTDRQCYYLKFTQRLKLDIPVILVGGNRDVERLESIVQQGSADFISLCRPLICEPDLPNRWLEGRGSNISDCISCNSCCYTVLGPGGFASCLFKHDKQQHKIAQEWLSSWFKEHLVA